MEQAAQQAAQQVIETAVVEPTKSYGILDLFLQGGFFMWPILIVGLMAAFVAIERFMAYRSRFGGDARSLFNQVKKYLSARDGKRALEICQQSNTPLGKVLAAGLNHIHQPIEDVETAMESEALLWVPQISARTVYLSLLANVATLLGLLGTVAGLIISFSSVGQSGLSGAERGEVLGSGIAVAMYTTAFGLIVAIPAMIVYQILSNQANQLIDEIQHYATELKKLIQRMRSDGVQVNDFRSQMEPIHQERKAS